jgi:hypothetical protein
MSQRELWLVRSEVPPVRDPGQHSAERRPPTHNTPIWKLEAALNCRSCRTLRYSPPVHMISLTETREIAPNLWVHPDDDR